MLSANEVLTRSPIVPVMVIEKLEQAVPLAKALAEGGIEVFEITLRTNCALSAVSAIREALPNCLTGVGTVMNGTMLQQAMDAGAQFSISPGLTPALAEAARQATIPHLPGVATISEAMQAEEWGFKAQKFFPAERLGGAGTLKSWQAVLPNVRFCPTGGIHEGNASEYLSLANVACVGGTWMIPNDAVTQGDWSAITALASQALSRIG